MVDLEIVKEGFRNFLWCHTHFWSRAHFHKAHDLLPDLSIEVKSKQIDLLPLEQESESKLLYNTSKLLLTVVKRRPNEDNYIIC